MKRFPPLCSPGFVALALLAAAVPAPAQGVARDRGSPSAPRTPAFPAFVLHGVVLGPAGAPADGAVVVSSAGGEAVTGPDGRYRLEIQAAPGTPDVRVTAVAGGGRHMSASTSVGLATPGIIAVAPLELAPASTCQPSWLPTFGPESGVSGGDETVDALAVFDDGRGPALYVGGRFEHAGGVKVNRIARWNGRAWEDLAGGMRLDTKEMCEVNALAVFDDGRGPALYAGGDFTSAGGVSASCIAKWDGARWSALGSRFRRIGSSTTNGTSGTVRALTVFDDGTGPALYVGGWFVYAGEVRTVNVAKWDGSSWSKVGNGGLSWGVNALAVFDDGNGPALHAGTGHNFSAGSRGIYRWNGSTWSELGGGIRGGFVRALAVFDDGSGAALYAAGRFTAAGGVPSLAIARWDGSAWTAVGGGLGGGFAVSALAVHDDGTGPALVAGGDFTTAGGVTANSLARWNGTSWTAFASETSGSVSELLVVERAGRSLLVAGGSFESAGGMGVNRIASWDGARWSALGRGLNGSVDALAVHDDGGGPALYAGGNFTSIGGATRMNIARWDGARWSALGEGIGTSFSSVEALAVFDDGGGPALHAAGHFPDAGGVQVHNIAKWDGGSWSALGSGLGSTFSYSVSSLAVFDDGGGPALYAGGSFDTAGGVSANNIAKWDGAAWSGLGSGVFGPVWALAVFDDGAGEALYAAGDFFDAGGVGAINIAKWDGGSWSTLGNGMNGTILCLKVFDDGRGPALYAGGYFVTAGAVGGIARRIVRWDGTSWSTLGAGMDGSVIAVRCLTVFDDGSGTALYAGGSFRTADGVPAHNIARWDGTSWSALGNGLSNDVQALAVFDDGDGPALHAGGIFFSAPETGDSYLARWGCAKARTR